MKEKHCCFGENELKKIHATYVDNYRQKINKKTTYKVQNNSTLRI